MLAHLGCLLLFLNHVYGYVQVPEEIRGMTGDCRVTGYCEPPEFDIGS